MWLCTLFYKDIFAGIEYFNNNMKKLTTILACTILLGACTKETIRGGGAIITENRNVPVFTEVQLSGEGEATILYGTTQQVLVTGYENLLPVYETKMMGTTLHLQFKPDDYRIRNNNIKVNITVPSLSYIRVNGSGKVLAGNFTRGDILSAYINGSGNMQVKDGKYNNVNYVINGSGDIVANTTEAKEANAEIHGSGRILLHVLNKLDANISGSGDIDYWGNPGAVNIQVSGSGKITKK